MSAVSNRPPSPYEESISLGRTVPDARYPLSLTSSSFLLPFHCSISGAELHPVDVETRKLRLSHLSGQTLDSSLHSRFHGRLLSLGRLRSPFSLCGSLPLPMRFQTLSPTRASRATFFLIVQLVDSTSYVTNSRLPMSLSFPPRMRTRL